MAYREVAEFKAFSTALRKPQFHIAAILYKREAKKMNNYNLGGLWWSVSFQCNTYAYIISYMWWQ